MTLPWRLSLVSVDAPFVHGTRMQRHNAWTNETELCYVLCRQLSVTLVFQYFV